MRRSSRKMLIVGALTLVALAGPVAAANAAGSLTLTPATNTFASQSNNVAVSGTAAGSGFVVAYAEAFGSTCAADANHESDGRRRVIGSGGDVVAAGAILDEPLLVAHPRRQPRVCGYLYADGQDPGTIADRRRRRPSRSS